MNDLQLVQHVASCLVQHVYASMFGNFKFTFEGAQGLKFNIDHKHNEYTTVTLLTVTNTRVFEKKIMEYGFEWKNNSYEYTIYYT